MHIRTVFLFFRSLSSNQLSTLPKELIEGTSRLDTLTLDDNPWVCDCRLNWLILWLQSTTRVSRSAASTKIPICMEPIGYQGQRLTSIRPLQCSEGKWLFHNQRHLVGNKANKLSFPCKAWSMKCNAKSTSKIYWRPRKLWFKACLFSKHNASLN